MMKLKLFSAAVALSALIATPTLAQDFYAPQANPTFNGQEPSQFGGEMDSRAFSGENYGRTGGYVSGYAGNYADSYADSYAMSSGDTMAPDDTMTSPAYGYAPVQRSGFLPIDVASDVVGGAIGVAGVALDTAGDIATAPFRSRDNIDAYASMDGTAANSCAQRFRSYDPATGTYLGYDGQRHPCG